MTRFFIFLAIIFLTQSCKKNSESLHQNIAYSITDTVGTTYSFSDNADAVIRFNRLGATDYFFVFIIESSYFDDPANGIHLPMNAIYMSIPNLQNENTQIIMDAQFFLTVRLNNISQIVFPNFTVTTKCVKNQNNTVSGTFNILAYTGISDSHYTISGKFTNARLE